MDARTPDGPTSCRCSIAASYWVKDASGVQQACAEVADELRASIQRDIIPLLLALYDRKVPARRLPDAVDGGSARSSRSK